MRILSFFLFGAMIFAWFQAPASEGRPMCVRAKEAVLSNAPEEKVSNPKTIPQYTPVSWTGKKEKRWFEVRLMSGQVYWVRAKDLSSSMRCLSVRVEQSRLYNGPGTSFEKEFLSRKGDAFIDLGGEDGWTQVENSEGKKAWINLDHTWKPATKMRMSFDLDK